MIIIALIDFFMGDGASTLNGYEIIRSSLPGGLADALPSVTQNFIIGQELMGDWALAWAWLLYLLWAALWSVLLCLLIRAARRLLH
jgi:hypothetical protein